MKSAGLTFLALAIATRNVASAAPTCSRVASQWTALFTAECTEWFRSGEPGSRTFPKECGQVGGVDERTGFGFDACVMMILLLRMHVTIYDGEVVCVAHVRMGSGGYKMALLASLHKKAPDLLGDTIVAGTFTAASEIATSIYVAFS